MGWDDAEEWSKQASSSAFLRLPGDGDTARVVFLGSPRRETKEWSDGPATRYPVDVFNVAEGKRMTWDMSSKSLKELLSAKRRHGMDCVYEIERMGLGFDTEYRLHHQGQLTDEIRAAMGEKTAEPVQSSGSEPDDSIPF